MLPVANAANQGRATSWQAEPEVVDILEARRGSVLLNHTSAACAGRYASLFPVLQASKGRAE